MTHSACDTNDTSTAFIIQYAMSTESTNFSLIEGVCVGYTYSFTIFGHNAIGNGTAITEILS